MPRKRKASVARAKGLRVAQEAALSAKRLRLTPDLSGDSESESEEEGKTSDDDDIVYLIL